MQDMLSDLEGDETVQLLSEVEAQSLQTELGILRSRCDAAYEQVIQEPGLSFMAQEQAVRIREQLLVRYRRGDTAIRHRLAELTPAPAPPLVQADHTAQMLKILRQREPKIGKFSGEPQLWPAFRDLFLSEVHHRDDLEPVTKLSFLKEACVDKAATALGLWSHTSSSYSGAWKSLCKRYEDVYKVRQGLFRLITGQSPTWKPMMGFCRWSTQHEVSFANWLSEIWMSMDGTSPCL